jgi:DNA (cytosine-5)-methyltransferase 1
VKFFDLFAGIGGFRIALEREGFTCVGFCEIDKWARKLYKAYYHVREEEEYEDATKINPEDLPDFDILCAGFPCQAFSIAGKRRGFEDTRGTLFFEIARIAKVKRPTHLLLENVKGLLSHNEGRTFEIILKTLDELGYDAEWQVLNSKDFGVPQNRERVFIIGHLRGKSRPKIFPLSETDKVYYKLPEAQKEIHQDSEFAVTLTARQYVSWTGNYIKVGDLKIRRLTPLECFRLQGFPDDIYYLAKKLGISDSQLYKMTGNAVTVQVVQSIARKLIKPGG